MKRSEQEIYDLIRSIAEQHKRIRTVLLNGSRANTKIDKDGFQDFDIVFFVKDLAYFRNNPNWIDVFGERIILQKPNTMEVPGIPPIGEM